jgi:hypothetical protein
VYLGASRPASNQTLLDGPGWGDGSPFGQAPKIRPPLDLSIEKEG